MLSPLHRGLLAVPVVLAFALTGAASAVPAGAYTCVRSGYATLMRDSHTAILERKVRGRNWERGPFRRYACSTKYGRFVPLGSRGVSPDGPVSVDVQAINDRYVVSSTSWSDNGDGEPRGGALVVRDLRTRSRLYTTSSDHAGSEFVPGAVALNNLGDLGWIVDPGTPALRLDVWMHRRSEPAPVRLASGPGTDPALLRWSTDGRRLAWADPPTTLSFKPRKLRDSDPLYGGRCTKRGDRVIGRGFGFVYLTREFRSPGWVHGRVLIACSLRFKRRVALAHSGEFNGATYTYDLPRVREGFAASVQRQTDEDGVERTWMMVFDLGREERICSTEAGDGLRDVEVPATVVDDRGDVAWTVSGRSPTTAGRQHQVRVCDADGARTLASGEDIDELLLRFDPSSSAVIASRNSKTAP